MTISKQRILYEDDHLLAVNKLSGELVVKGAPLRQGYAGQAGKVGKLPLLDFLKKDYSGLRALHRIDFETSGVILFAKTKEAADVLKGSSWTKTYQMLVAGRVGRKSGVIRKPLLAREKGTVEAETHFTVLEQYANSSYVEATIETGRHHQIRRHFQFLDHPLVLDSVYGNEKYNRVFAREFGYRKFFLHAIKMELQHPVTGEELTIEAPLPKPFVVVLKRLRSLS